MKQRYTDHLVVTEDYGCAIRNIAEREGRDIGFVLERLLDNIPEVKVEVEKIRKGKK